MNDCRLVVGVLSGKTYEDRRKVCRDTWMADLKLANVPAFFLVGDHDEQSTSDDTLYLNVPDDYGSLSWKTRAFCQFALDHYNFEYIFKCDDDTYVRANRLIAYDQKGEDYIGIDPTGEKTFNSGGAGYFLSRKAAEIVARELTERVGAEDLFVGKLLRRHGVVRTQDTKFQAWKLKDNFPRPDNEIITAHYRRGSDMTEIHDGFK
jgi:hypothetical protein